MDVSLKKQFNELCLNKWFIILVLAFILCPVIFAFPAIPLTFKVLSLAITTVALLLYNLNVKITDKFTRILFWVYFTFLLLSFTALISAISQDIIITVTSLLI